MIALLFFKTYSHLNETFRQLSVQTPEVQFLQVDLADRRQEKFVHTFQIRAVPTILLLQEQNRFEGYLPLEHLQKVTQGHSSPTEVDWEETASGN